ncbi:MAG: hypothetical protein IM631_12880 [Cytophagales bacterium]|nr:hypothetical protein [Cytophagales bacterium]MCA6382412.1 hypothetical protein [Cytophagales bacterium]
MKNIQTVIIACSALGASVITPSSCEKTAKVFLVEEELPVFPFTTRHMDAITRIETIERRTSNNRRARRSKEAMRQRQNRL